MSDKEKTAFDYSKPLPTEQRASRLSSEEFRQVNAHDAQYMASVMNGGYDSGASIGAGYSQVRHEPEYYAQWRKDQQAAIDKGEDPVADFAKRAREHSDNQPLAKMANKIGKLFGKGKDEEKNSEELKQ